MSDLPQRPSGIALPAVPAPPPFDRRLRARRRADHHAQAEVDLLARCLDVLAAGGRGEERLAALLELLAETAGAERAAVLADAGERRVAVAVRSGEDSDDAQALAAWLDTRAPRTRAERAAAPPALVSLAVGASPSLRLVSPGPDEDTATVVTGAGSAPTHYACLTVPSSWPVALGFAFRDEVAARDCARRMPPSFIRHATAAIAQAVESLAAERELELLRAQDEERSRFVSTIAHELRTPLTGLGGYLELILTGSVSDPTIEREFLERSHDIVASIDELVGDLLELSRIESGSLRLEIGPYSVAEVCERVAKQLGPIALGHGVRLETSLPPRLRAGTGDRRRVEQILRNLVGNALKFTPSEGNVELAAWFDGPVAVVAVRDDGHGISPDDGDRIWDRFYRMASHSRVNGTGLGLPIARELARAMSGDLGVASVPRVGSSFVLVLPGATAVASETSAQVLERTVLDEEARLEERGMLRRLQALERTVDVERDRSTVARSSPDDIHRPVDSVQRAVHLRAIDGGVRGTGVQRRP